MEQLKCRTLMAGCKQQHIHDDEGFEHGPADIQGLVVVVVVVVDVVDVVRMVKI